MKKSRSDLEITMKGNEIIFADNKEQCKAITDKMSKLNNIKEQVRRKELEVNKLKATIFGKSFLTPKFPKYYQIFQKNYRYSCCPR